MAWMKLSKLRVILLVLVGQACVGLGAVYLLRAPIKSYINEIRAERVFAKAEEAFAAERWADAARLGTAAHHLDQGNLNIDLLVARALLKQRNAAAISWWNLVLDSPAIPVDELRELTAALLSAQQLEEALPFLSRLVQLDGDNPETHRLWLQSLQIQHRYQRVRTLAGSFAEGGSEDWSIHQAYLHMQRASSGAGEGNQVLEHLRRLLEEDGPLSLNAARELVFIRDIDPESLQLASRYLVANGESDLDKLHAASAEAKAGLRDHKSLTELLVPIVEEPNPGDLEKLLRWARWMNAEPWYLEQIDYATFRANEGNPDMYLGLLLSRGKFAELLELTETAASEGGDGMAAFLYYRSAALEETGEPEAARNTLNLAVQTVDPANYDTLERYLARDGRWNLLSQLYDILIETDTDNSVFLIKALGARYYSGRQDDLKPILERINTEAFETKPDMQGFLLYTRLLEGEYTPEVHKAIEELMANYPEVFDFRLILGVSYVLQGRSSLGRELLAGMPGMGRQAPRYLRVAAVILGLPAKDLLLPGETETLLPRELFLISLGQTGESSPPSAS